MGFQFNRIEHDEISLVKSSNKFINKSNTGRMFSSPLVFKPKASFKLRLRDKQFLQSLGLRVRK